MPTTLPRPRMNKQTAMYIYPSFQSVLATGRSRQPPPRNHPIYFEPDLSPSPRILKLRTATATEAASPASQEGITAATTLNAGANVNSLPSTAPAGTANGRAGRHLTDDDGPAFDELAFLATLGLYPRGNKRPMNTAGTVTKTRKSTIVRFKQTDPKAVAYRYP